MISHEMNVESLLFVGARLSVLLNQFVVKSHLEILQRFEKIRFREIRAFKALQLCHEKSENILNVSGLLWPSTECSPHVSFQSFLFRRKCKVLDAIRKNVEHFDFAWWIRHKNALEDNFNRFKFPNFLESLGKAPPIKNPQI